ncbi:hypothetical protein KC717_02985 [Candidatus Dojkabacteria bacterium]|uniref:Cupin domain-containing protein n=1 Tax=Candidatus Dojkabacteria bacterium TaxID=2099670 RepID=A0A955RKP2_9BACT|nr:hypothetical protein [Candidatus Dojkabacteria bacterium]
MAINVYTKGYYAGKAEEEVFHAMEIEGFTPLKIRNNAGYIYYQHEHKETKLLAFLGGSMEITIESEVYKCSKGDRIYIPGTILHEAVVGTDGCVFFWAEKVI